MTVTEHVSSTITGLHGRPLELQERVVLLEEREPPLEPDELQHRLMGLARLGRS